MDDDYGLPEDFERMLDVLTDDDKLRKFRYAQNRDPVDEDELDGFIEELARGLYNEGWSEWPENDEELA